MYSNWLNFILDLRRCKIRHSFSYLPQQGVKILNIFPPKFAHSNISISTRSRVNMKLYHTQKDIFFKKMFKCLTSILRTYVYSYAGCIYL